MIAAIDIGNSFIHTALFRGSRCLERRAWPCSRFPRGRRLFPGAEAVVVGSVNPEAARRVMHSLKKHEEVSPRMLGRDLAVPIRNRYRNPRRVGMDRLANAAAAFERARRAGVIIDVGTAVTIDVVSPRGEFLGGAIAPGPSLAAESLHRSCSLLPSVTPAPGKRSIARDTAGNIRAGIYWGLAGLIHQTVRNVERQFRTRPYVIGTGGGIGLVKSLNVFDAIVPALTLEGIALSYYHSVKRPCPFCRRPRLRR